MGRKTHQRPMRLVFVASDYDPNYSRHLERLQKQKEAQLMASKKRPPLAWDIDTQGFTKMPIRIFLNQKEVIGVVSYNAEAGWLLRYTDKIKNGEALTEKLTGSILVVRAY